MALENECPLFPEHLLEQQFAPGDPRGNAGPALLSAVETPVALCDFLEKAHAIEPSLGKGCKWAKPNIQGRARRISQGPRYDPPSEILALGDTKNSTPDPLKRTRSAICDPRSHEKASAVLQNTMRGQYHWVVFCPTRKHCGQVCRIVELLLQR